MPAATAAIMDCGPDATTGKTSDDDMSRGRGSGSVEFMISAGNEVTRLQTTMEVRAKPNGSDTLFLWPGLEPLEGGENFNPIGRGVLQPVLTWGSSCAPGSPRRSQGWWISAQYVNTLGSDPEYRGCFGGEVMNVAIGDQLQIDMSLKGSIWSQTVTDEASGKTVDFDMDLEGQDQLWIMFQIEMPTSTKPSADVVFTNTVITMAKPEPEACRPSRRGTTDYYSAPMASRDGLRCCMARLVLRSSGVGATTMP